MSATHEAPPPPPAPLMSLAGLIESCCAEAKARESARAAGKNPGPVTGFKELDDYLGDCFEPGLHLLHGAPGSGKSALAIGFALNCLTPSMYVTAELRPPVVMRRLIARTCSVPVHEVKRKSSEEVFKLCTDVARRYPMFGLLDGRKQAVPIGRMKEAIETIKTSTGHMARGLGALIVVDSLHTWATRTYTEISDERERLDTAIEHLELLASTLEMPVLAVCERNRMGRRDTGQAGMKGTGRLEYAGETVMGMDEVLQDGEEPQRGKPRLFALRISKNREGEPGKLPLYFNGAMQRHELITEGLEGTEW